MEKSTKTLSWFRQKVIETQPLLMDLIFNVWINALNKLPGCPLFYRVVIFMIETANYISKIFSPKGEYDFKLEDLETAQQLNR
jgi:hypothetical protein